MNTFTKKEIGKTIPTEPSNTINNCECKQSYATSITSDKPYKSSLFGKTPTKLGGSALLLLFVLSSTFTWGQQVGDKEQVGDFYYVITSITPNTVSISQHPSTNTTGNYGHSNIVIPATVTIKGDNYDVTKIEAYAFQHCKNLSSITIPSSVTEIGSWSFGFTEKLYEFTVPSSITTIGVFAFRHSKLKKITIPASVTIIEKEVFSFCEDLIAINVVEDNPNYCSENGILFNKDKSTLIQYPANSTPTEYKIPSTVKTIGSNAFDDCANLQTITIPNSVTEIGGGGFGEAPDMGGMKAITTLISEIETVSNCKLNWQVFGGIDKTTCTLKVPEGKVEDYKQAEQWKDFGENIKENKENEFISGALKYRITSTDPAEVEVIRNEPRPTGEVIIPEKVSYNNTEYAVTSIGEHAFSETSDITAVTIPNSVKKLKDFAFIRCHGLTSIVVPNSVTEIGYESLGHCDNLSSITLSNSLTKIPECAFSQDKKLTTITIPESVNSLGVQAFWLCSSLQSINLPKSINNIGGGAFNSCTALNLITSEIEDIKSVTMGANVFDGVDKTNCKLKVPVGTADNYKQAEQWKDFTNIVENKLEVGDQFVENGITYEITSVSPKEVKVVASNPKPTGEVNIPTAVNQGNAKSGFKVVSIDANAFANCTELTSVNIPKTIKNIGDEAFANCTNLTSVTLNANDPNKITMGNDVFKGVDKDKCKINVPKGTEEAYKNANQWQDFNNIEEKATGIDTEQIPTIKIIVSNGKITLSDVLGKQVTLYDLSGRIIYQNNAKQTKISFTAPQIGVYILQVNKYKQKILVR